ncbi:hypothetical protein CCGE531_18560 [Rhizobium sp. CCGE531]|nr:hypothetical protein CCGE531_18560 [Rhizobium sp. CCGE531]
MRKGAADLTVKTREKMPRPVRQSIDGRMLARDRIATPLAAFAEWTMTVGLSKETGSARQSKAFR